MKGVSMTDKFDIESLGELKKKADADQAKYIADTQAAADLADQHKSYVRQRWADYFPSLTAVSVYFNDGKGKTGVSVRVGKADTIPGYPAFYLVTLNKNAQDRAQLFFRIEPDGAIYYGESHTTAGGFAIPPGEGGFTNGEKDEAQRIVGAAIAKLIQQP